MSSPEPNTSHESKWLDIGFKIISILVIPLLAVGINLYTETTVLKERVGFLQQKLVESDAQVATVNSRLTGLADTLQTTSGDLREIRAILSILRERAESGRATPSGRTR